MNRLMRSGAVLPKWLRQRSAWLLGFFSVTVIGVATLTLSPGATRFTREALGDTGLLGEINEHLNPFRTRHALYQSGLPIYDLKITPAEYREILAVIDEAKRRLPVWKKERFEDGTASWREE